MSSGTYGCDNIEVILNLIKCEQNRKRMNDERKTSETTTKDSEAGGLAEGDNLHERRAYRGRTPRTMRKVDD